LSFAALAFCVDIWSVVPAPTLPLLALAVIVPELAPWSVLVTLVALLLVLRCTLGRTRIVTVGLTLVALSCAAYPLAMLPATLASANASLASLRTARSTASPAAAPERNALQTPFDVRLAFTGFAAIRDVRVERLSVVTRDGIRLGLDLYRMPGRGARPTLVLVYGGAWIFGSLADLAELGRSFARLGYTVIAIDYRHAPQFRFPTQRNDVDDALETIARHASAWDVDPKRVALFGRSAGAELVLLAAYRPQPLRIRAVVGYYSPTDLVRGYASPPVPDPADIRAILRTYVGGTPAQRPAAYAAASPITSVRPGLPPTLLVGGARDELIRLSLQYELRDALTAASDPVVSIALPWSNHAFDSIPSDVGGQIARYYTQRFLAATL
jgi:acetyl esterase/lipase